MSSEPFLAKKTNRLWVFLLTTLALLASLAMWRTADQAMQMKSRAAGSAQFAALKPGEITKVVLEVTGKSSEGQFTGKLLEKKDETGYTYTATEISVAFDGKTPVVMGKVSDVRPAAILHVTGSVAQNHTLQATQLVVLTGYVTVR
jgi:hypothetical protein